MEKDDRNVINKDKRVLEDSNPNTKYEVGLNRGDTYSTDPPDFFNKGGIITDQEYEVTSEIEEKNKKIQ